ncbi:threonine dehydratase [Haloprofundus marisrubri]|uniref:threonine ammonia-lyase n=1 Tax=Haloprofundus marisrubri TaxID=1514971 RepID=A0A0W1R5C1_9EURY|nr:threonine ammonia-lyase [Haloprofundus marisrubri]KTG08490.1 threonine dehydratase [Haloprofundus marisrubri]
MTEPLVTLADIEAAAGRLDGVVKRTPVDSSRTFAERCGADSVHLKLESLQRTGSFKIRGASNRIAQLSEEELDNGIVAASGGNHAQGVASAATAHGADATIVMPEVTPMAKIEATRGYGAEVVVHGEVYQQSYGRAMDIAEEKGATFVHPFNDRAVIAGQGTVGLEMVEAVPDVDTVVVAIGGGGLVSGIATAVKAQTDARVVGVQTEGCAHMSESLERDEVYERHSIDTITEGIAASKTEEYTFRHVSERVDDVVNVTDAEVTAAMALLAERSKLVTESAGAVALAALLGDYLDVTDETVAVPVCGANIDLTQFTDYVKAGLAELGRYRSVRVVVDDWPKSAGTVAETVENAGATVDELSRLPPRSGVDPGKTELAVTVEGSGSDHLDRVVGALDDAPGVVVSD